MGVVGQFVMIGDLYSALAGGSIGTGNGSQVTFTGTLAPIPIYPSSVFVQDTTSGITALDNGNGTLSGTGITSGTINYDTGAISVTFSAAPAAGTIFWPKALRHSARACSGHRSATPILREVGPFH